MLNYVCSTRAEKLTAIRCIVGEVRRAEIPLEGRVEWVATICKRIGDWFEGKRKDYLQLTRFESEIDHLKEWQENAARYASVQSSRLMWLQAYPHYHRAQYAAASNYLTDAWRIFEQLESGDRELKANLINDLTVTSGELGTLFSVPEPTEALSIRQELFGELHPDVANSLNTLSHWYGGQGDLETALD